MPLPALAALLLARGWVVRMNWSSHAKMMMDGERFRHFETTAPAHVNVPTQVILISQSILAWGIVPNLC